jgi:hypothetical protein
MRGADQVYKAMLGEGPVKEKSSNPFIEHPCNLVIKDLVEFRLKCRAGFFYQTEKTLTMKEGLTTTETQHNFAGINRSKPQLKLPLAVCLTRAGVGIVVEYVSGGFPWVITLSSFFGCFCGYGDLFTLSFSQVPYISPTSSATLTLANAPTQA